jgi:hypothetical protein
METVLMHGPGISNPNKIVEREVPLADVNAYARAGYVEGGLPVYTLEDAIAQNDGVDESTEAKAESAAPVKRTRKAK